MNDTTREQIARGEIRAIALDTSIFDANGLALESGLLEQLSQFRDSGVTVVLPKVVTREVERHLLRNSSDAIAKLQGAIRETGRHRTVRDATQQQLDQLGRDAADEVAGRAQRRLEDWIERTAAVIAHEEDYVALGDLMQRYFDALPPFGTGGPKKHEFPDAVALLTLDGWARKHGTKVLVVSADSDWKRYGDHSGTLVLVDDLAEALSGFQGHAEAREAARCLAASIGEQDSYGLQDALRYAVQEQSHKFEFRIEADSQFSVEEDGMEASYDDVELPDAGWAELTFEAVFYREGEVVVQVNATALARVTSYFTFDKWDSVDHEYMSMGNATIKTDERIEFEALVTLTGNIPREMTIESVELLATRHGMHLNDIEPDWMSSPDDDPDEMNAR